MAFNAIKNIQSLTWDYNSSCVIKLVSSLNNNQSDTTIRINNCFKFNPNIRIELKLIYKLGLGPVIIFRRRYETKKKKKLTCTFY
jgi:hypothetical protein